MPNSKKRNSLSLNEQDTHTEQNPFFKFIGNLGICIGLGVAGMGSVMVLLLLLEQFSTLNILFLAAPFGLLLFIITNKKITPTSPSSIKERRLFDILALLFVIAWAGFNLHYTAQTVYLYRDPALYNTTAKWMMENDNINIPSVNPYGDIEDIKTTSNAGVNTLMDDETRLYTHGLHVLPSFTALVGRLTDDYTALKTNVFIAAVALLAVYSFARLVIKPRWAFLVTIGLGLSLPMLYFSRDMYTEPISMLFLFSALAMVYYATKSNNKFLWLLAGFATGASILTRIDAYIGISGIFIFLFVYLALYKNPRKQKLKNFLYFIAGFTPVALIAWLDLRFLATAYYRFHDEQMLLQLGLIVAIFIIGIIFTYIAWEGSNFYKKAKKHINSKTLPYIFLAFALLSFTIILLRPLVFDQNREYEIQKIGGTESIVIQDQQTPSSITYNTGENTFLWPVWYLGLFVSLIAAIGFFLLAYKSGRDTTMVWLPFLFTVWLVCLLYFFKPSITPDHIWASRRMLPIIFPGILILAMYIFNKIDVNKTFNTFLYLIVSIMILSGSLGTSHFFIKERENYPLLKQVKQVCNDIPNESAILLVGIAGLVGVQTFSSYCGVPTVRYVGEGAPTKQQYMSFYINVTRSGFTPVIMSFKNDVGLLPPGSFIENPKPTEYKTVEKVFEGTPSKMIETQKEIVYGKLNPNGSVVRIR